MIPAEVQVGRSPFRGQNAPCARLNQVIRHGMLMRNAKRYTDPLRLPCCEIPDRYITGSWL